MKGFKIMLANRNTKLVLAVVLFALFFQSAHATSTSSISAATASTPSYAELLNGSIDRHRTNEKLDEPNEALQLISANSGQTDPSEITARLKRDFPSIDPNAQIRVLPIMRENLILQGTDYTRLVTALAPLLKFYGLEGKVIPLLYKSEQPVAALCYPNGIVFSTRQLDLLSNDELESLAAHEIAHLVGYDLFKTAIDQKNKAAIRLIELFCDAAAASTLQAMGKNPRTLLNALYKTQQVLELEYGEQDRKGQDHPTLSQRDQLNKELVRRFGLLARR